MGSTVNTNQILEDLETRLDDKINLAYSDIFVEVNNSLKKIFKDGLQQAIKREILEAKRYLDGPIGYNEDSNNESTSIKIENDLESNSNILYEFSSNMNETVDSEPNIPSLSEPIPPFTSSIKGTISTKAFTDEYISEVEKDIKRSMDAKKKEEDNQRTNQLINEPRSKNMTPGDSLERIKLFIKVLSRKRNKSGKMNVMAKCKICSEITGRIDYIRKHIKRDHSESLMLENIEMESKSNNNQDKAFNSMGKEKNMNFTDNRNTIKKSLTSDATLERMKSYIEVLSRQKNISGKINVIAKCKLCTDRTGRIDFIRKHIRRDHSESLRNEICEIESISLAKTSEIGAKSSEDIFSATMKFVETLEKYTTEAGNTFIRGKCKLCPTVKRIDDVRKHVKKAHKETLDEHVKNFASKDNVNSIKVPRQIQTDHIMLPGEAISKPFDEVQKKNVSINSSLHESAKINAFMEILDREKKVGNRIKRFARCKVCNLEAQRQNVRRHIIRKHPKILGKKSGKSRLRRHYKELSLKTDPFIEILGSQRYASNRKRMLTNAQCKVCSKIARIDHIRTHVAENHIAQLDSKKVSEAAHSTKLHVSVDKESIEEIHSGNSAEMDLGPYIETLNKQLSKCKICSITASEEEIRQHLAKEHSAALEDASFLLGNVLSKAMNGVPDENRKTIEKFTEHMEPRSFGNEKAKRSCLKCKLCQRIERTSMMGKHLRKAHRDEIELAN